MNTIITALDIAKRDGVPTVSAWVRLVCARLGGRIDTPFTGNVGGTSVVAIIDSGRWIARCECGGAEYVAPAEPIFYCFACANHANGGDARPVQFPANVRDIEWAICKRPLVAGHGLNAIERVLNSKWEKLPRNWNGETLNDIQAANEAAGV